MYELFLAQAVTDVTFFQWVSTGGTVGALLLFLYGFKAEWWVTGEVYRRRLKEVDEYKQSLDEYRDKMEEKVLPLLSESNTVLAQLAERRRGTHGR